MSGNKKPRKAYRPKKISIDPISEGIYGAALFMPWQRDKVMAGPEAGFDLLRQGKAHNQDWNEVSQGLSVAEALCRLNIGNNLLPQIEGGISALTSIAIRMMKGSNPTTCYAAELAAIREALDMYKVQLRYCSQGEFSRAVQQVTNMLTSIKTGTLEDYMEHKARLDKKAA
jgi:hypothetical protein